MWVEGPWRAPCQLKKPFKGLRRRRGSSQEEQKRIVFPLWGVIDLPYQWILQKGKRKNWVSGHTWWSRECRATHPMMARLPNSVRTVTQISTEVWKSHEKKSIIALGRWKPSSTTMWVSLVDASCQMEDITIQNYDIGALNLSDRDDPVSGNCIIISSSSMVSPILDCWKRTYSTVQYN